MKQVLIFLVAILLMSWYPNPVQAVDVQFSMDIGVMGQENTGTKLAYGTSGNIKLYDVDPGERHFLAVVPSYLRSKFGGDTYLARLYPIYYQRPLITIGKVPINIAGGVGGYWSVITGSEDDKDYAQMLMIGVQTWEVAINVKGEVFEATPANKYFIGASILWLF